MSIDEDWRHFFIKSLFFLISCRGTLVWQNGRSERIFRGRYPWSHAGFSGPQPEGNGDCLAILNNVYQDRVKYHDVACHHKKPTICECPWRKWKKIWDSNHSLSLSLMLFIELEFIWNKINIKKCVFVCFRFFLIFWRPRESSRRKD